MVKQVLIIRKDLGMRKGKFAVQAAHAAIQALLNDTLQLKTDTALLEWFASGQRKICVYVNSEQELIELYKKALSKKLRCSLITDSGITEFNGQPTKTAVAIGPNDADVIDEITSSLPLL